MGAPAAQEPGGVGPRALPVPVSDLVEVDVVGEFANTSAASLPIALACAAAQGRLHAGDRVLLAAFGAGMVWAGGVLRWGH